MNNYNIICFSRKANKGTVCGGKKIIQKDYYELTFRTESTSQLLKKFNIKKDYRINHFYKIIKNYLLLKIKKIEPYKYKGEVYNLEIENDNTYIADGICVHNCDGYSGSYQVVEELLKIKHIKYIIGNHCLFFINHIETGWAEDIWTKQGGANTIKS